MKNEQNGQPSEGVNEAHIQLKKNEQKLRKLKIKWQLAKESRDNLVQQVGDLKRHNE